MGYPQCLTWGKKCGGTLRIIKSMCTEVINIPYIAVKKK